MGYFILGMIVGGTLIFFLMCCVQAGRIKESAEKIKELKKQLEETGKY